MTMVAVLSRLGCDNGTKRRGAGDWNGREKWDILICYKDVMGDGMKMRET